jgi:hypothetical protein
MNLIAKCMNQLRKFSRKEDGSGIVEFVLMFPLLCWALLATASYFHAFRSEAIATKTTLTLADMVSRETDYITPTYLNNVRELLEFLSVSDVTPDYRLTVIRWNGEKGEYRIRWSRKRGRESQLKNADLVALTDQLPILSAGQNVLLFETWTDYVPQFDYNLGLGEFQFKNFVVMSPRFSTQICWNSDADLDPAKAKC